MVAVGGRGLCRSGHYRPPGLRRKIDEVSLLTSRSDRDTGVVTSFTTGATIARSPCATRGVRVAETLVYLGRSKKSQETPENPL